MKRVLAILLLVPLLGAACSRGNAVDPASLPTYESLQFSETSLRRLFERREQLVSDCMRGRGFGYPKAVFIPLPGELARNERRWGPIDATAVRSDGYHPSAAIRATGQSSKVEGRKQKAALAAYSGARLQSYSLALTGIPAQATRPPDETKAKLSDGTVVKFSTAYLPGSCQEEADKTLYAGLPESVPAIKAVRQLVDEMAQSADAKAMADKAFTSVVASWSRCFTESGYDAADPLVAMEKYAAPGDSPTADERRAATADVACKARSRLWETWQSVLDRHWRAEAAKHGEVVLAYREVQQRLESTTSS
jgi:hypothetical protein